MSTEELTYCGQCNFRKHTCLCAWIKSSRSYTKNKENKSICPFFEEKIYTGGPTQYSFKGKIICDDSLTNIYIWTIKAAISFSKHTFWKHIYNLCFHAVSIMLLTPTPPLEIYQSYWSLTHFMTANSSYNYVFWDEFIQISYPLVRLDILEVEVNVFKLSWLLLQLLQNMAKQPCCIGSFFSFPYFILWTFTLKSSTKSISFTK